MPPIDEASNRPVFSSLSGYTFLAAGAVLFCTVWLGGLSLYAARLTYELSALSLICAGGFLAASFTAAARARGPIERVAFTRRGGKRLPLIFEKLRSAYDRILPEIVNIDWRGDWLAIFAAVLPSLLALNALADAWPLVGGTPPPSFDEWCAAILFLAAFPVLVCERHFAQISAAQLPEAPSLQHLLRVPILVFLLLGLASGLRWLGISEWLWAERLADIVIALVAAELVLRSAAYVFIPLSPIETRESHADSIVARLIRLQRPDFAALNDAIHERFGIDLTRSWALAFIRRAALPVFAGMVLFCWLLTGVTALGIGERAVYEAFGQPSAVFTPGLHVHLPWPFGVLRPVEYGVVHEIPIVFSQNGDAVVEASSAPSENSSIEGIPPPSADRLWTADHPSEASYLVASVADGKQSFEIADIDLRIIYRVGLSDQDARDVVYNVASPDSIIRATAGRMLARYFARYTIADLLGQNREAFVGGFEKELRARLASLDTGIEIMAVVVEAIHPPSGAAASYQGVEAAAIRAQVAIATARANAVTEINDAQRTAIGTNDDAAAAAAERVDQANAQLALFAGDHEAHLNGGEAFLFERRLERLNKDLASMPLTIIDHRIAHDNALTIDLRPLAPGASTYVPEEP